MSTESRDDDESQDRTNQTGGKKADQNGPDESADKKKGKGRAKDGKVRPEIDEDPDADERLREAHYETFPASDPPSFTPEN